MKKVHVLQTTVILMIFVFITGACQSNEENEISENKSLGPVLASTKVNIVPLNDAPILVSNSQEITYTENEQAVPIDAHIVLSDPDDQVLTGAKVSFSSGYHPDEDILLFDDQNGIKGTFDSGTGTLSLTGNADIPSYQAALRSVRYRNNSTTPTIANRSIIFTVNDGKTESAAIRQSLE